MKAITKLTFAALVFVSWLVVLTNAPPSALANSTSNIAAGPGSPDIATFSSNVPLVILNTLGNTITNFQKRPAWVTIMGVTNGRSSIHGVVEYDGHAGVSVRGNSSRAHPKKAFRLELRDAAGNDFKAPLLGMPKESDWILFPAYTDKTLIRDALAYELWGEMGHYAPRTRFVELFIVTNAMDRPDPLPREREQVASGSIEAPAQTEAANANEAAPPQELRSAAVSAASLSGVPPPGKTPDGTSGELAGQEAYATTPSLKAQLSALTFSNYHGVYVLMEKIKRAKNRVNIQKSKPDPADSSWLTGGYILKKDRRRAAESVKIVQRMLRSGLSYQRQ